MKVLTHFRTVSRILPLVILSLALSCSDSSSPESQWESIGVEQVHLIELDIPTSISTGDTLLITMVGDTKTSGQLTLSSIDVQRESDRVTLSVWAEVKVWVGSGMMPTIDPTVQCTYKAIPPFEEGILLIIFEQPDASTVEDSVTIEN